MHEWILHIQQLVCEEEVREHGKLTGFGEKENMRGLPRTYHFLMPIAMDECELVGLGELWLQLRRLII